MAIVLIIVAALASEYAYADQILPGIKIDGISYAKQNRAQLTENLSAAMTERNKQGITFTSGDAKKTASLSDLGVTINTSQMIDQAYNLSHDKIVGLGPFKLLWAFVTQSNNIKLSYKISETTKKTYFEKNIYPTFSQQPTDASLNLSTNPVTVNQNSSGMWVDNDALSESIGRAIVQHQTAISVPLTPKLADILPENLTIAVQDANSILNHQITLLASEKTFQPSREEVAKWINVQSVDNVLRARIDGDKLKSYLNDSIASKVNAKSKNTVVDQNNNTISTGQDGVSLVIDDSITAIQTALASTDMKQTIRLAVKVQSSATTAVNTQDGSTPGQYPGKYIEINLTLQRMYLYEGSTFVNSFRVSTGKWSTPTPTGTFSIQNAIRTAYSSAYGLYMPYWHAITPDGAYGIHGLPYRGNWVEGASHIGTPVSHGCVRLGSGDDVFEYNWADIGTPVVIHK